MEVYRKNDLVTVVIDDIGSEGEGIGKIDGFTLFVKDAVPGDTVTARILKSKKTYAYAKTEKVITPSPFRVEPPCAFHRQCGGCQLQAIRYGEQLEYKQRKIENNLIRIGGFSPEYIQERTEPIIGMDMPLHYRNKAQYPVGTDREGNLITGFYAGRTHSIIANTDCLLGAAENREILENILEYMRENQVSAYDESTGTGLVRHILIRKGFTSGELMVCLVINFRGGGNAGKRTGTDAGKTASARKSRTPEETRRKCAGEFFPEQEKLIERLERVPGMTSISVNINTENTNVILGPETYTLWGSPAISDTIHVRDMHREGYPFTGEELTFRISPLSFYQVNPVQTEKLYSLALEYAGLTGRETVWDLYCGIGTISLFLAGHAGKVYGVEAVPQAIEDARENAARNGITNAEFFVGKAEEVLPEFYENLVREGDSPADNENLAREGDMPADNENLAREGDMPADNEKKPGDRVKRPEISGSSAASRQPDVIVVDPPRKGCDAVCLETMLKMQPQRIVYVSCDSATLARDLRILCDGGYEIQRIRGVDQFGMTVHVETVCLISRLLQ